MKFQTKINNHILHKLLLTLQIGLTKINIGGYLNFVRRFLHKR